MSDMVDNQMANLKQECYYKFFIQSVSKDGTSQGEITSSPIFQISYNAISPMTIISTQYDPWTKQLTVVFRFDDVLGRTYDITGLEYSIDEYDAINKIRINNWIEAPLSVITGNIYDLHSNMYGDNVAHQNLIIKHKIIINIDQLGLDSSATDSLRLQFYSDLSINREGLTMPSFYVKLWANEFLKPIEERISFLQGYKNQRVYEEKIVYNE
jgi:hypothetical protein